MGTLLSFFPQNGILTQGTNTYEAPNDTLDFAAGSSPIVIAVALSAWKARV
jgi:hypothetical protein